MPTKEPMSWKMRVLIVVAVLFLLLIGFVFTPWGHNTMKGWLDDAYADCPAAERRAHWAADWYINLAWWEATICRRKAEGKAMLREFLGILPSGPRSFRDEHASGTFQWKGKFDAGARQGWGILHPRACEAYHLLLEIDRPDTSAQETSLDATFYKTLFWDAYSEFTSSDKPHPKFYKYWQRVSRMINPRWTLGGYRAPPASLPGFEGPDE